MYVDRFHAAVPVSDNRILVSGGCSAIGALQDVHVFSTGEQRFIHSSNFCKFINSIKVKIVVHICPIRFGTKTDMTI